MKILKKRWYLILICLIAILAVLFMANPKCRVGLFVDVHGAALEDRILSENPDHRDSSRKMNSPYVPSYMGIRHFNTWEGEHDIIEFSLFASGFGSETAYYGCYYSFDNVPVAFQNAPYDLDSIGDDWIWFGEGDNWGVTCHIRGNWYFYKACF